MTTAQNCEIDIQQILRPSGYLTYQQFQHSQILHGALTSFMCFVWISEQTATITLYSINRLVLYNGGGECLLRGTD